MKGSLIRVLQAALPSLRLPAAAAGAAGMVAVRGVKTTTGIVGLPVDEEAREHLKAKLQEVLDALAVIPETAEYRKAVEKTVAYKLKEVVSEASDAELEDIFSRQLEEEIKFCNEELTLIPKMAGAQCAGCAGWQVAAAPPVPERERGRAGPPTATAAAANHPAGLCCPWLQSGSLGMCLRATRLRS